MVKPEHSRPDRGYNDNIISIITIIIVIIIVIIIIIIVMIITLSGGCRRLLPDVLGVPPVALGAVPASALYDYCHFM